MRKRQYWDQIVQITNKGINFAEDSRITCES